MKTMGPEVSVHLTFEEHCDLARELRLNNARIRELSELIETVYGPGRQAVFSFQKATEAVDRLCRDMQDRLAKDYPGHKFTGLYL